MFRIFCIWLIALSTVAANAGVVLGPALGAPHTVPNGDLLIAELNCAACHRPTREQANFLAPRSSPILGKGGLQLTPQYLRRYLADPHGYKPGTTMPDQLHALHQDERANAVEALVHFLISEQVQSKPPGASAEDYMIQQGKTLYHTIGCVACHAPEAPADAVPGLTTEDLERKHFDPTLASPNSVPLGDLARKLTVEQLARFLIDPLKVRPSGRMPAHNLAEREATSIAMYLLRAQAAAKDPTKRARVAGLRYRYFEQNFGSDVDFEKLTPKGSGTVEKFSAQPRQRNEFFGFLYTGSITIEKAGEYTFSTFSDDGSQLFINGKLIVDNNGDHAPQERSGKVNLGVGEHAIVVTFYQNVAGFEFRVDWEGPGFSKEEIPTRVLSHVGEPMVPLDNAEFVVDRAKAENGREQFVNLGCAACHKVNDRPTTQVARALSLSELRSGDRGCLAERPPANAARFDLTAEQRSSIIEALEAKRFNKVRSDAEQIEFSMAQMNCVACHTRDAKGGPTDARLAYFRMNGDVDMGDEGRIPPHLTGVGGKLRPEWLTEVLKTGSRVRPYMATRMPQFGMDNVGHLAPAFARADVRDERKAPDYSQRDAKFGRRLAGVGGLACISCHTFAGYKSLGIPALDMTTMAKRLRYDWFHRYLIDPPSLRPGTRMPSFWPGGEAVNKEVLEGKTDAQITALWSYLSSQPETDLPAGLVQGRKEIVTESEPVIYRNFIQGAGTRAIGVGYPEKVNLAFDANNLRLAMIWQGPFIDAARHSSGRGEGFEPPLGNNVVNFPEGPQFAQLSNEGAAWPKTGGRAAGYRMLGYSLDEQRRPIFSYEFNGVRIDESFDPVKGEIDAYFKRTFRLKGSAIENLWLRLATGNLVQQGERFLWNTRIELKFPGTKPVLREIEGKKELIVPVHFENGAATIVQEIIW